jgi:hypothetical protein
MQSTPAKRPRLDTPQVSLSVPRDPRSRPPIAVSVAPVIGTGTPENNSIPSTGGLSGSSQVGFSHGQLSSSATSAQLTPANHVQLLQQQMAALTEERDALLTKRAFWRDEANTQRQVHTDTHIRDPI